MAIAKVTSIEAARRLAESHQESVPCRDLPDGRCIALWPQLFTYKLTIGRRSASCYDDMWCYARREHGLLAMQRWNPETDPEPVGWIRHPISGRRQTELAAKLQLSLIEEN